MLNVAGMKIKEWGSDEVWVVDSYVLFGGTVFAKNEEGLNKLFKWQDIFESYNRKAYDEDGFLLV